MGLDHGDFAIPGTEYEVECYTEHPAQYHSGLSYPICIGDVLEDRYRIEHKLGYGQSSTVWLAHDTEMKKDVALKIMAPGSVGEDEYNMQKEIIRTVQDTSNLVTYLTTFSIPGFKGNHRVLVLPVRGPTFDDTLLPPAPYWSSSLEVFSGTTRMSAARHLLKALESLHNAGIVHHSELTPACCSLNSVHANYSTDLNRENVMWGVAPLDNLETKAKYKYLGRPLKVALSSNLWRQGELVRPLEFPEGLLTDTVYLGNFGLATKAGTEVRQRSLPYENTIAYCAPERLHNINPSFSSDMWSYMCLFMELYLGIIPWESYSHATMIIQMVEILGPLPKQWEGRFNPYGKYDNSWYDHRRKPNCEVTLESIIKEYRPEVSSVERNHVLNIMSKGFCYSPDDRPTATQLLHDPSFQAVMEIYCC
jgi:serine/threonine protein kinase